MAAPFCLAVTKIGTIKYWLKATSLEMASFGWSAVGNLQFTNIRPRVILFGPNHYNRLTMGKCCLAYLSRFGCLPWVSCQLSASISKSGLTALSGQSANLPICQSANLPFSQSHNLTICQSANLPIYHSHNLTICQSANLPIGQFANLKYTNLPVCQFRLWMD